MLRPLPDFYMLTLLAERFEDFDGCLSIGYSMFKILWNPSPSEPRANSTWSLWPSMFVEALSLVQDGADRRICVQILVTCSSG